MDTFKSTKRSYMSAKAVSEKTIPLPVIAALEKLGSDLQLARRRRRWTQESMAERIQTSVATLRRMEKGDPRIPISIIAQAFFVLSELPRISGLLDTAVDDVGLTLMNDKLPKRIHKKASTSDSGAI